MSDSWHLYPFYVNFGFSIIYFEIDSEAIFKDFVKELRYVIRWFELGIELDIPTHCLSAIREDYRTIEKCRLEMLIQWQQQEKPTWRKLILALINIEEKQIARELAIKYGIEMPISNSASASNDTLQGDTSFSPKITQSCTSKQLAIANYQRDELKKELNERKTEFISLQEKVQKLSDDLEDVKTELTYKIEEMEVIQQSKRLFKSKNFKAAKERLLRGNEEQIKSLKIKLKKTEEELEKAKQMLEKKEKELEEKTKELNAKSEETRQLKYEMSKMQQEFNSKEKELIKRLAEMGVHSETQKKVIDQIEARLDVAIKETSTKNAEIDTCIKKLSDKDELISKLSENIDRKERERKSLQERLKSQIETEDLSRQEREQQLHSLAVIIVEQNLKLERVKDEKIQLILELNKAKELQRHEAFVKQLSDKFTMQYESFEKWLTQSEELVSQDISSYSFQECEVYLTEIQNMKEYLERKEKEFNETEKLGKILPGECEEDESKQITEKLGALEQRWHSLITQGIRGSTNKTVFVLLDLLKYYPQKLTQIDSIIIQKVTLGVAKCTDPKQLYLFILQKIKTYNYQCMENILHVSSHGVDHTISEFSGYSDSDNEITPGPMIHPVDSLLALIHCADDFLRQDLIARLVDCQVSIPLILPDPFTKQVTFILWALRGVVKEWKSTLQDTTEIHECPLISYKAPIVSFVRFGKQTKSKSKTMNDVISDMNHNHFFHRDCESGSFRRLLGDGLIDLCWYLPSGKVQKDIFPDPVLFLNLHGNAKDHPKQTAFLSEISFVIFAFITEDDLCEETTETLQQLSAAPGGVVLCTTSKPSKVRHLTQHIPDKFTGLKLSTENADEVKKHIRKKINEKIQCICKEKPESLEKCSEIAKRHGIYVDENKELLVQSQKKAHEILMMLTQHHDKVVSTKEKMLTLQGRDLWQKWAKCEKEEHRQLYRGGMKIEEYSSIKRREMNEIRKLQLQHIQNDLSPLMESFIEALLTTSGSSRNYYLQYLKLCLNELSRQTIASLKNKCKEKQTKLLTIQSSRSPDKKAEQECKKQIEELKKEIIDASLGLEHLLRELGQVYEAVQCSHEAGQRALYSKLPRVAAELLIDGYPFELIDGDAAHVPQTWVTTVIQEVTKVLKDPRVFVLSVLGLQSTGKSTLINTTFGLQFNVGAKSCTRGAFMQLLPISDELKCEVNCDYILVVDTEGLCAPELDSRERHQHDNEFATFIIGLANSTLINFYGEAPGDMDDILQTAVHAFLHMKEVTLKPSCHFVHQNTVTVTTEIGKFKLKERLDIMTSDAAIKEKTGGFMYFSDVINFDEERDIQHFPCLWRGNPPMAPINPGYSFKALELKTHIVKQANQTSGITKLSDIELRFEALWKAVLHEKFVFSFKNTLELSTYNSLEAKYAQWSFSLRKKMLEWERNAEYEIKNSALDQTHTLERKLLQEKLPNTVSTLEEEIQRELLDFFKESEQHKILAQWKTETIYKLKCLATELKDHAYNHCYKIIKTREDIKKKSGNYENQLIKRVETLVSTEILSESEAKEKLRMTFDKEWSEWIKDLQRYTPAHCQVEDICAVVEIAVQQALIEFYPSEETNLVKKISAHVMKSSNKQDQQLTLTLSEKHITIKPGKKSEPTSVSITNAIYRRHIENNIKNAFDRTMEYLASKQNEDFHPALIFELLKTIQNVIVEGEHPDFVYTKDYELDVSIVACRYAIEVFTGMRERFLKENDPVEFLRREMKTPLFSVLESQYYQIAGEKVAGSTFCDLIGDSVEEEVKKSLCSIIVQDMRLLPHLANKSALKGRILLDLGDNLAQQRLPHALSDYFLHLQDVTASYEKWLTLYTKEHCEHHDSGNKDSRLVVLAKQELDKLIHSVCKEVKEVAEENKHNNEIDGNKWLRSICMKLGHMLDMTVFNGFQDLSGVRILTDVQKFSEEVQKGLEKLQNDLQHKFVNLTIDDLKRKPHQHLFDLLCGCTQQCPFCGEDCDHSSNYHTHFHRAQMHRPVCLTGIKNVASGEMVADICSCLVDSGQTFRNKDVNDIFPFRRYKEIYPNWSIIVDQSAQSSFYWKWFVGNYSKEIAVHYGAKGNNIPSSWRAITWEEAKLDIQRTYGV